mmetsp:Transcript_24518/g.52819  ORF Transcript_24518/g.52819 Transcript_24518/m.52819 type:complete len:491 (+) Transcript_24518:24-1496(+)|eukprot:CAMPEP_0172325748 /NCGR_PEP_ID=MMETSP1058-20130122/54680_1 /TAXON_ID=83371 /ORGANISM="Detonula confervacea, Strain CCMP 353" /LENGTH=490 /DNA_ID=CAMNT_0013042357 /DNA_START=17 /DNA_END=1489 /DNA_ORIENTATION=+
MKRKADCPQCHGPVKVSGSHDYEKGILPNKQLEQQVDIYKLCRDPLREQLVRLDVLEKEKTLGILGNDDGTPHGGGRKRGKATTEQGGTTRLSKRARSSRRVAKNTNYSPSSSEADSDDGDGDYDDASNSKMPSMSLAKPQQLQQQQQQLKRKPTVSYHSMNKKKLVQLCQKEGLNTHGNDQELKQRHSGFITLYNSECDSEHPRSVKELVKEMKSKEMYIKMEANKSGPRQQSKLMKNLGKSLDSNGRPTSGNEIFDAKLNNKFATMIAEVKKKKRQQVTKAGGDHDHGDPPVAAKSDGNNVQESGSDGFHCEPASVNQEATSENHHHTATASSQQQLVAGNSELGRIDNDAVSPTASMDSDKTVETPQKFRQNGNHKQTPSSPPPSKSKVAAVVKHRGASSAKKSKFAKPNSRSTDTGTPGNNNSSSSCSRVSNLGPWVCNTCTFENLRNVARRARCQMCDAVRPVETGPDDHHQQVAKEVEIVNIDC